MTRPTGWLHRVSHWLGMNGAELDGHDQVDGHTFLMTICVDCGERKALAHSLTCWCKKDHPYWKEPVKLP